MKIKHLYIGSLTSLAVIAASSVFAEEIASAPMLEGGVTAMIGTFYAVPSSDDLQYFEITDESGYLNSNTTVLNAAPSYDFGWQASLGYLFEDTANGIELFYRGINSDDTANHSEIHDQGTASESDFSIQDTVDYELNAVDLMISQFLDIGTHMQMRFLGGLAYVELEQTNTIDSINFFPNAQIPPSTTDQFTTRTKHSSEFRGLGPRLAIDARYDFGEDLAGFGIVGGASVAYFLGETDVSAHTSSPAGKVCIEGNCETRPGNHASSSEDLDNHAVTNLRGNLGIDYVYFFDNEDLSTLGIELGYMVDFYDDSVSSIPARTRGSIGNITFNQDTVNNPLTFSGPYLNLKAVI